MAEEPDPQQLDDVKRHIDSTRLQLGEDLRELESRARRVVDWRTYFDKNPMTMLALAFAVGLVFSRLGRK
jgi:hypothetical protein